MPARDSFTVTSIGVAIPLLAPHPQDIQLRDVAHHLALANRMCGATQFPFSTAQHSVILADLLAPIGARHAVLGLLYNSHEAYLGHMAPQVKAAMFGAPNAYKPNKRDLIERAFYHAVLARFGIERPSEKERSDIAVMDEVATATAWRDLMPDNHHCPVAVPPARFAVGPMPWDKAEQKFREAFDKLTRLAGVKGAA